MFPMVKRRGTSLEQFAERYGNTFLREALGLTRIINSTEVPLLFRQMSLAWMHRRFAGYPRGGSGAFARAIERRFLELGGEIRYEARVVEILVERDRAIGLRLEDGTEVRADHVLSAGDGRATIFEMLKGAFADRRIRGMYDAGKTAPSVVQVALGVARTFDDVPVSMAGIMVRAPAPIELADRHHRHVGVCIYNFAPDHAPDGRTVVKAIFHSAYEYWANLARERDRYVAKKTEIAEKIVALLDGRFPGLAAQVEMTDVATPATYERHTGNWRGSPLGWDLTTRNFLNSMKKQLPGLKNFYMAGQWVEPGGGVPIVALSGRNAMQLICHRDRRTFRTTEAE
jgi:phytoene dehydrogenase-like protein